MGVRSWYNSKRLWNVGINYELIKRNFSSLNIHTSSMPNLSSYSSNKNVFEYLLIQDGIISIGHSLKGYFVWDCKDNSFGLTVGHFFKVNSELIHVENGSNFWKNTLKFNKVFSWLHNSFITISTTFKCGYIKNLTFFFTK